MPGMSYTVPSRALLSRSGKKGRNRKVSQDVSKEIGVYVRHRRKANKLTQRELGDLAGVGTRFISELERGKTTVRLDAVNKVLAVFGKTLSLADAPKPDDLL